MAISVNGGGFGNRRRSAAALSEINVTPFVDVVLVLLIIFMLTAQVMEFGIQIDVPKVRAVKESAQDLPIINITRSGDLYLGKDEMNIHKLNATLSARYGKTKAVYVRADKDTVYQPIADVLAELQLGGYQVNLVTQTEDSSPQGRK